MSQIQSIRKLLEKCLHLCFLKEIKIDMKKKLLVLLGLSFSLSLISCGNSDISPDSIIDKLQEADYPIDNVISYTENDDPNKLLGKPGQYKQKISFADMRLEQQPEDIPVGGSIETFENKKDSQDRIDYLKEVSMESSFSEYSYLFGYILLRLNENLTSDEAKAYIAAVQNIIDGKEIEKCIIKPEDTSSILVYFSNTLSENDISQIGNSLEELPGIIELGYTSGDESLEEFAKIYLGEDNVELAEGFLQDNHLTSSYYTVTVMNGNVDKISSKIEGLNGVRNIEVFQNSPAPSLVN